MNIAGAAASPNVLKTLTHFFYSTLPDPSKSSKGKYTQIYHNNIKVKVEQETQRRFPELYGRMTAINVGHYVTNWHVFQPARPQKQADGSYLFERTFSPDLSLPFIYTHKDMGPFVRALVDVPAGKRIHAYAEMLTWPQFAEIFAQELGVKASYRRVSDEDQFAGVPEAMRGEFVETFHWADEFGMMGAEGDFQTAEEVSTERPERETSVGLTQHSSGCRFPLQRWPNMSAKKTGRLYCEDLADPIRWALNTLPKIEGQSHQNVGTKIAQTVEEQIEPPNPSFWGLRKVLAIRPALFCSDRTHYTSSLTPLIFLLVGVSWSLGPKPPRTCESLPPSVYCCFTFSCAIINIDS